MATSYSLDGLITGDLEEDAARLKSVLETVAQMLSENADLAKKVPYRVKEQSYKDKDRLEKWQQEYKGPDPDTVKILDDNHQRWLQDPSAFWIPSSSLVPDSANPQVKIVDRYLQTTLSDA